MNSKEAAKSLTTDQLAQRCDHSRYKFVVTCCLRVCCAALRYDIFILLACLTCVAILATERCASYAGNFFRDVEYAKTKDDALDIIYDLLDDNGSNVIAKAKSNTLDEYV